MRDKQRVLCLCVGGTCRSVTIATLLKYQWDKDALAGSLEKNCPLTLKMLFDWANVIVVADEELLNAIPSMVHQSNPLIMNFNLGKDQWGMSMHPDLVPRVYEKCVEFFGPCPGTATPDSIIAKHASRYDNRRLFQKG